MEQKSRGYRLFAITVLVLAGIAVFSLAMYDTLTKEVNIVIDGEKIIARTSKETVAEIFEENGISIDKSDYLNIPLDSTVEEGMEIEIRRAVPVTVNFGGDIVDIKTSKKTVREILDSLELEYYEDKISPSIDNEVFSGMEINIVKVEEKVKTIEETIPYEIVTKDNAELEKGILLVLQDGIEGIKEVSVKEVYENGQLVKEEIVEEKIVSQPVEEIVEKGTKEVDMLVASRGSLVGRQVLIMEATAYDLSYESTGKRPGDKWYGITASGTKARPGVVAVDPKVIPLGTKLYIESMDDTPDYGYAVAEDTGGAIKGNRIDLFMEDAEDVKQFGRRNVKVYILGKEE